MPSVRITQVRSAVSRQADQGRTLRALGLTHLHASVVHEARPEILGMVRKVSHLVAVENLDARGAAEQRSRRRSGSNDAGGGQ